MSSAADRVSDEHLKKWLREIGLSRRGPDGSYTIQVDRESLRFLIEEIQERRTAEREGGEPSR